MKKILIVTPEFGHGGTNRSLLNLMGVIDREKYDIDIFVMRHVGPYQHLFRSFHVLPENPMLAIYFSFREALANENLWGKLRKIGLKAYMKLVLRSDPQRILQAAAAQVSKTHYDVAVAFQESAATEFVSYVRADRRLAWVRCDYRRHIAKAKRDETGIYSRFDKIIAVSQFTAQVFRDQVPAAADRTAAICNMIDYEGILRKSREPIEDPRFVRAPFTLVSVGRMDPVKRFSHIPGMAAWLKEKNIPFRWYIIGDGGEEKQIVEDSIREHQVQEQVILLGEKDNPYPYIAAGSVLVCPSWSEACPNVVNEGKILHVPVVAADFPSAKEFLQSGVNGIISPIESMASQLGELYENKELYQRISQNLSDFVYDNAAIKASIEKLFDGENE